ncbi:Reverse transcriptase [Phytophthora palmivora]|uniref:Reverse transcriptase n=1 Tax=Phytophthora palmivora TaxID=4796 RepID=A0A2P4YEC3_9STRA|nr:Reverse transcriptase [Phytophthora palmivora]
MSDFFRTFNKIVGQSQRATMAYRPQANGTTERMVGTLTRAVKIYVEDIDQRDWDEYAERLTFALNTAQDRVRGDTPFYLLHGWDQRSTLEAMIPLGSTRRRDREPRRWRYRIQKQYQQAREGDRHNETVRPREIEVVTQVWLYLDRVKEGYARKLPHMWHGPFRVLELVEGHAVRLDIAGTEYRLFPVVHVSKIKPVRQFPDRLQMRLTIQDQDRYDIDEALLPEDSWIRDIDNDEYEVEKIVDMRSGKRTRFGRTLLLGSWKGYDEPTWVDEADLNCGALLHDYLRDRTNRNRFKVMQSHEEP